MARGPIHPGETLREDLDALGMGAADLARRIDVPPGRIARILDGRRAVTGDTALRLGRYFGTSGEFWLNLQKLDELRLAGQEKGAEIARLPTLEKAETGRSSPALPDSHVGRSPPQTFASGAVLLSLAWRCCQAVTGGWRGVSPSARQVGMHSIRAS